MLLSYRCYKEDYIGLIKLTFHNDMKEVSRRNLQLFGEKESQARRAVSTSTLR